MRLFHTYFDRMVSPNSFTKLSFYQPEKLELTKISFYQPEKLEFTKISRIRKL